jgi:DNA-binding transcriptional LysR family regulator
LIILLNDQTAEHDGFSNILKDYANSGFIPNVSHHTTDLKTLFVMVAAELGIAVLPEYTIKTLTRTNTLITIPLEGEQEQIEIILAWNKNESNPCISLFLDSMNSWLKQENT